MNDSDSGGPIVGIDLGTTNSLVAWATADGIHVLAGDGEDPLVPSVVRFGADAADGVEAVGTEARSEAASAPDRTVFSAKRLMGRAHDEHDASDALPYRVVAGTRGMAAIDVGGRVVTPQEVAAAVLGHLRERAERTLGVKVGRAVVTVPAYFDDAQRQATRDAGRLAGLEIVRIINEPTAAALAYGIGLRQRNAELIAVFDLGGGTFDVSILRVEPSLGAPFDDAPADGHARESADRTVAARDESIPPGAAGPLFEVLATAGDTHLGGDDLDVLIAGLLERRLAEAGAGPVDDAAWRQRIRAVAERAKIDLSIRDQVEIDIATAPGRSATVRLTRREIEELARPLIGRALACVDRAIHDARVKRDAIDRVVLVGGSTRMPAVREAVASHFGVEPYTALDPDQVVAMGAALQAGAMAGARIDMLLLDVIPLSLGIETVGGAVAKLVMRNTAVPARATEMFSTSVDGQTSVRIHVVQGERELVRDCRSLGTFDLGGVPPMPAGIPQIQVEFLVDANGILSVSAVERRSGRRAAIQVVPAHGLTVEEVERIERESLAHARSDMHVHRIIDLAVNAELDVKWIRDALRRVDSTVDGPTRETVERHIAEIESFIAAGRRAPESVDAEAFHRAKQALDEASVPIHELAITASLRGDDAAR